MKTYSSVKEMMLDVGLGETKDRFLNLLADTLTNRRTGRGLFSKQDGNTQFRRLTHVRVEEIGETHAVLSASGTLAILDERRIVEHVEKTVVHYDLVSRILQAAGRNNFLNVPDDYTKEDTGDHLGVAAFLGVEIAKYNTSSLTYKEEAIDDTRNRLVFSIAEYDGGTSSRNHYMTLQMWKDWANIPHSIVQDYYEQEFDR